MNINSNKSNDLSSESEFTSDSIKTNLANYLESRKGMVSFDDIRENVVGFKLGGKSQTPDGHIHQACFDCGYTDVQSS